MKANRSAKNKVLGGINWWDYLNSIRQKGFRNTPQYLDKDEVQVNAEFSRITNRIITKRKQTERRQIQWGKLTLKQQKHKKKSTKGDQIQRGFDLAAKLGWNGINRTYYPSLMKVFGGSKRKNK